MAVGSSFFNIALGIVLKASPLASDLEFDTKLMSKESLKELAFIDDVSVLIANKFSLFNRT